MKAHSPQWYHLTDAQLAVFVGKGLHPGAPDAWDKMVAIDQSGGKPAVYYSEAVGFNVFDESDIGNFQARLAVSSNAKAFPGQSFSRCAPVQWT